MSDFSSSYINLQPYTPFDPMSISGFGSPMSATGASGMVPTAAGMGQLGAQFSHGQGPGGVRGMLSGAGIGANMQTFNAALGGIQTLGSLWGGMKQLDLAKKQLKFTKEMSNINLGNQTKSYNTAIQDRARSRGVVEGQSQATVDDYIARNSLDKRTIG